MVLAVLKVLAMGFHPARTGAHGRRPPLKLGIHHDDKLRHHRRVMLCFATAQVTSPHHLRSMYTRFIAFVHSFRARAFCCFLKVDRRHPPTREFRAIILKDAVDNNIAVLSEGGGRESQSSVRRHGNRAPRRHGREAFPSFALLPVHPAVLQGPGGQGPGQVRGNEATPKRQNEEANHKADKTPRGSIGNT